MKPSPRPPRTPSRLSESLHHQLSMYAFAASAAGLEVLALAQPSEAKIIYTKTHQVIGANGVYPLDLNHDGIIDFLIEQSSTSVNWLLAQGAYGNAVEGKKSLASALKKGSVIGPGRSFTSGVAQGAKMVFYTCTVGGTFCRWSGQWINVTNLYLGLKFQIHGKTHYGWARLSTLVQGSQITATLTGYAYETIAHKGLRAGQTSGAEDDEAPSLGRMGTVPSPGDPDSQTTRPASLGQLAAGAGGVAPWRRP